MGSCSITNALKLNTLGSPSLRGAEVWHPAKLRARQDAKINRFIPYYYINYFLYALSATPVMVPFG